MNFGICDLSVIPVRLEPSDKSEMVSQLLFGEPFEIREQNKQWLRIHSYHDDYDGWIDEKQIQAIPLKSFKELTGNATYCSLDLMTNAKSRLRTVHLPIGSSLPYYNDTVFHVNEEEFKLEGTVSDPSQQRLSLQIPEFALRFLDAPYLWGGRSPLGLDCSGFTNVAFKLAAIRLRRDAWQQSEQGILVSFIDESRPGDLAFFHNEDGKITHVGIMLADRKIIHASGRVRIDTLDHYGIFNEEQKRYTHQLRLIKRIIA